MAPAAAPQLVGQRTDRTANAFIQSHFWHGSACQIQIRGNDIAPVVCKRLKAAFGERMGIDV